jgi:hypothetical protein
MRLPPRPVASRRPAAPDAFEEFQASVLFCNRCRVAQPVRERLLLVLPDGELLEYLCTGCGTSLGSRRKTGVAPVVIP